MNLQELREKLKKLNAESAALLETADAEGRDLTEEEETRFNELDADFKKTEAAIRRAEQVEKQKATLESSAGRVVKPKNNGSIQVGQAEEEKDPQNGFDSLADFALSVKSACVPGGRRDQRLDVQGAPSNYHQETGSADGYMVPPAFRNEIWNIVFEENNLLNLVNPEPTESNSVELLADESTPWGTTGVQAYWRAEGSQMTPSRLSTEGRTVKLHELYAFVLATDELLADAPRLNQRLTLRSGEAIRWKASDAIMNGTGAGQPLGYLNANCLVSQAKESGQAAATVVADNIAKMVSRLLPSSFARAVWLMNSDVIPELVTMTLGDQPIWTPPASGFQNAIGGYLFGRPIILTEHCQTLGTVGDIQLIDPAGYYAAIKQGGMQFAESMHLYFDYGVNAFRWTFRVGGQPYLSAAVSPNKGTTTKSHFVVLATRS